jgi:two-component system, chemotaxis family, protein-glutamate methylesterase/glutaminase
VESVDRPPVVVTLVASAGGLDAVSRVLSSLPADLDAAVLVLIHQQPDHESHLVGLLARQSALSVGAAEHGSPLTAGHVLVAPPGKHLLMRPDRTLALIASGAAPPSRPSADLLLTSVALAAGSHAIAVILSGGGHDGATGATAIHDFGGTVIASDEESSSSASMPLAAIGREDCVDHVAPLDEVADLVRSLVSADVDTRVR